MEFREKEETGRFRRIAEDLRSYVEKRLELFVLTLLERVTFILADTLQRIIGILLLAGGLLFAWFALSFFLSAWLGSHALGFLVGSLPLILAGVVFVALQPVWITRKIQEGMLSQFLQSFDTVLNNEGKEKRSKEKDSKGDHMEGKRGRE